MAKVGNWRRWAAENKMRRVFAVGVVEAISPFGLQGVTSRDGPLGGRESSTISLRKVLLAPHAARHHSLCDLGVQLSEAKVTKNLHTCPSPTYCH